MPKNRQPFDWSKIPLAEVVGRLFPAAAGIGVSLDEMTPGRYWPAWQRPPDGTALDREVAKIVNGERAVSFKPRDHLGGLSIFCPFYAWRVHTANAVKLAEKTSWQTSGDLRQKLQDEEDAWISRIAATKRLLRAKPHSAMPMGSLYPGSDDLGGVDPQAVYDLRATRFGDLSPEIARDEACLKTVRNALARIKAMTKGGGARAPDPWRTPFLNYMSGLWVETIEGGTPNPEGPFGDILEAATRVISGDQERIREWGQKRSLDEHFKKLPADQGYGIGEQGAFELEGEDDVRQRGQAMRDLMDIAERKDDRGPLCAALASAAVHLRDHAEGHPARIMRDLVLWRLMIQQRILKPHTALQLGWAHAPVDTDIKTSLRAAVVAAKAGDRTAAAVVQLAHEVFEDARTVIDASGWPTPFAGFERADFAAADAEHESKTREGHPLDGDCRALRAAMLIFDHDRAPESGPVACWTV